MSNYPINHDLTEIERDVLKLIMVQALANDRHCEVQRSFSDKFDYLIEGDVNSDKLIDMTNRFYEAKAQNKTIWFIRMEEASRDYREATREFIKNNNLNALTNVRGFYIDGEFLIAGYGDDDYTAISEYLTEIDDLA